MPVAVLFDFDGTLADTEPLHFRALQSVFSRHGIRLSLRDYLRRYVGLDDREAIELAFSSRRPLLQDEAGELLAHKGRAFLSAVATTRLEPCPGARDWLRTLRGRVPLGLCSGALPTDIAPILRRFGLSGIFDAVVTAADVRKSKPHPESYRLALCRLQARFPDRSFPPDRCLAVEDTVAGIRSAQAAGLKVLALTQTHPSRELTEADYCMASLDRMSPEQLF